jgi:NADP-dependent 3-hydroxy acid dehydrogenase YdfG
MLQAGDVADAVRFAVTRPPRAIAELLRLMPT